MNSSPNSADPVLVAATGLTAPPAARPPADPYAALDDLMTVVEALCPVWPARPGIGPMPTLRL